MELFLDEKAQFYAKRFEQLLDELDKRGILFVVATGNQISRMKIVFGNLANRLAYVVGNGSHLLVKDQTIYLKNLNAQQLQHFLQYYEKHFDDYHVVISSPEHSYMTKGSYSCQNLGYPERLKYYNASFPNVILLDNMLELPHEKINKSTMQLPMALFESVIQDFRKEFPDLVPMASGFGAIDVVLPGVDKALGIKELMALKGISADQVMTFGDGDNDISMLRLAKYSYAMENASKTVKAAANFIAPSNAKSGVFQVIEQYLESH
ncbi:Cof-type HAD-IIB family hydrolase [Streptococcus infantarius]|uniref:Cof-type HAD-IIB family hydrolase n=1 Tax=Streptococcus infantarius TaxID=102684 RepID=UPI0022E6E661|nr:Cof-type HAD-IIB family hydrolase [Streptococcus infantarius]